MTDLDLVPMLDQVKALRANLSDVDVLIKEKQLALEQTEAYQVLTRMKEDRKAIASQLDEAEHGVKEKAVEAFKETKNKNPLPGIAIKIFKILKYDRAAAEEWARVHAPAVFKFDTSSFEKVAVELAAPGVTVVEEPRAQIASKLE